MEQKRVLWIVAAVGLFLLVVIGTALWISSPSSKAQPTLTTLQNSGNAWSRNDSQLQPVGSNVIIADTSAGQNGITNIDFSSSDSSIQAPINLNKVDSASSSAASEPQVSAQETQAAQTVPSSTDNHTSSSGLAQTAVTLNVNITPSSSSATAYNETSQQPAAATTAPQTVTVQPTATSTASAENKTVSSAPASTATTSSSTGNSAKTTESSSSQTTTKTTQTVQTTQSSVKVTASATSSSSVKTVPVIQPDQYWVQVASFTGKKNAEDARAALSEQKITGEVFTYQGQNGTIYYRLRVGPYKTQSEAEYWHTIIKEIEQFEGTDSYVVNSTVK